MYRYYYLQQIEQEQETINVDDDTTNDDLTSLEPQNTQLAIQRPQTLKEVHTRLHRSDIANDNDDTSNNNSLNSNYVLTDDKYDFVGVYCESGSGLERAEQLRQFVNISCRDIHIVSPA